jgi:hypothetical protein
MRRQYENEKTPEGRMAAIARDLMPGFDGVRRVGGEYPDYADFREAFKPYLERELLAARLDEALLDRSSNRVFMLVQQLKEADAEVKRLQGLP